MATLRLDIEEEEALDLIGLSSSWPEHRLVWSINKSLGVKFSRTADHTIEQKPVTTEGLLFRTPERHHFSMFVYEGSNERMMLVANLGQGRALYDKGRRFDYLLMVDSAEREQEEIEEVLKEQRAISAIARIACDKGDQAAGPFNEFE